MMASSPLSLAPAHPWTFIQQQSSCKLTNFSLQAFLIKQDSVTRPLSLSSSSPSLVRMLDTQTRSEDKTVDDCFAQTHRVLGGRYAPESLMDSLEDLETAFLQAWDDSSFREEFNTCLAELRPASQLNWARKLTMAAGGARIYLKREDQDFTGSHSIINALGQALLARRLGRTTILAETGSGGHGVATAAVCQKLGLECIVYMGARDFKARPDQVKRMKAFGATVVEVSYNGGGTIREAITEVLRAAVEKYENSYALFGGPFGPRPIPEIAATFQNRLGTETKSQIKEMTNRLPDAVVTCSGLHCPAVGLFQSFIGEDNVRLVAVEGAGCGIESGLHSAVLTTGSLGVYHGSHTLLLQDVHGQVEQAHSVAPDLCYPSVAPQLAEWMSKGRIEPMAIGDDQALFGCAVMEQVEGIKCSIEDGHAIVAGMTMARKMDRNQTLVICLSGNV